MDDYNNVFDNRCQSDPQGVIQDLLAQSTRQARKISQLMELSESVFSPEEANYLLLRLSGDTDENSLKIIKKLKVIEKVAKESKRKR